MSADILFGNHRMWSAKLAAFERLFQRVRTHCPEDAEIDEILTVAEECGGLGLYRIEPEKTRMKLTKAILSAAIEWRNELPTESTREIEWVTELINFAQQLSKEIDEVSK